MMHARPYGGGRGGRGAGGDLAVRGEDPHEILGNRVSVAPQHKKKKHIHSRANHGSTRDGSRSQHPGPGAFGLPPSTGFPAPGFPAGGFPPPPGYGMPMHPDAAYAYGA